MKHIAYCAGNKVCTVERHAKTSKWQIVWHSRQDSRESISSPAAAKEWLDFLLHGKVIEWKKEL